MSATLIKERRLVNPKRSIPIRSKTKPLPVSRTVVERYERVKPVRQYSYPHVTDDDEIRFVRNTAIWMVVFAVTPIILFYIITFFHPDIFMNPIAP